MYVRLAGNENAGQWDDYVRRYPLALPYHLYAWKRAVEKAYVHRAYYLMAEEDKQVRGVLPLIYLKPPLLSGQLVSLPFCDVGDALSDDEDIKKKLVLEAVSLAQKLKAAYIELRGQLAPASLEYLSLPVSKRSHKVRMYLELPQSSDILWDSFKSKRRSQIRKSIKNGLIFKWGSIKDLNIFYDTFSLNMRYLGSPVHSKKWFNALMEHYGEDIRMGLVYYNSTLVGVGIILSINKIVSIPWASTLHEYNQYSPNMLLYWNFLKFAADNGYTGCDFGRSTPDEGTYRFKAQWGAKPLPLFWNYIAVNNKEQNFDASNHARKAKLARLWQILPMPLANFIGPAIRKYISL
jgi:FemAB-related protein (PEP-CTERM system-associated)